MQQQVRFVIHQSFGLTRVSYCCLQERKGRDILQGLHKARATRTVLFSNLECT